LIAGILNKADYQTFLKNLVGKDNANSVQAIDRYNCSALDRVKGCGVRMAYVITDYVFACANRHLAENAPRSTYAYNFSQLPQEGCNLWGYLAPLCSENVCHATELPYVFNTPEAIHPNCSFRDSRRDLADAIQTYWTSFAKSQSPSGKTPWPPLQSAKTYMILKGTPQTAADPWATAANCAFWDKIGYQHSEFWNRFLSASPEVQKAKSQVKSNKARSDKVKSNKVKS